MGKLSPTATEITDAQDAETYDRWFRAKVQASLADMRPSARHEDVMADIDHILVATDQSEQTG